MMERLNTDDESHAAIMRRNFGLQWTEPENYDVVFNTERVSVNECIDEVTRLVRSDAFAPG